MTKKNDAVLYLRMPQSLRRRLTKRAAELHVTVAELVRGMMEQKFAGTEREPRP